MVPEPFSFLYPSIIIASCCTTSDRLPDCLFLDIRVPGKAIKDPSLKLPVISWYHGGAYIFGAKDQFGDAVPFYDGVGLIQQSGGNVIFVSSNYRVRSPTFHFIRVLMHEFRPQLLALCLIILLSLLPSSMPS